MPTVRALVRAWTIWGVIAAFSLIYYALWRIATAAPEVAVVLRPGETAQLEVPSLWGHSLEFEAWFRHEPGRHREANLGSYRRLDGTPGKLAFPNPGEPLYIAVSVNGGPTVMLEAMPASAWTDTEIARKLTPDHATAAGEWKWPPRGSPRLKAVPGRNDISVTVAEVGTPLVGERIRLLARPPLTFNSVAPYYGWLWYAWLLCPLGAVCLALAALPLISRTLTAVRRRAE